MVRFLCLSPFFKTKSHGSEACVDIFDPMMLNRQMETTDNTSSTANAHSLQHQLQSDITLDATAFAPGSALSEIGSLNDLLADKCREDVKWWEVINNLLEITFYSKKFGLMIYFFSAGPRNIVVDVPMGKHPFHQVPRYQMFR
jgi:hypothetical protein